VVEDDPEDLSAYGLDEPTVLTLEDDQGWSGTLLVGGAHPDGGRYVQLPGISAVLRDRSGDYSFLELDALQLRSRLIFIHNIKDVVRAEFTIGGQTHTLMLDDRAATDTEAESFTASLDGGEILPNNARRIYTRLISFMMEGENEDPGGETVYTQTLTMRDGGVHSLELRAINDRHLAAVIDGEAMGFYVNIKQVQEIEQALAINAAGDEIPL
jgi:hypothetical protein